MGTGTYPCINPRLKLVFSELWFMEKLLGSVSTIRYVGIFPGNHWRAFLNWMPSIVLVTKEPAIFGHKRMVYGEYGDAVISDVFDDTVGIHSDKRHFANVVIATIAGSAATTLSRPSAKAVHSHTVTQDQANTVYQATEVSPSCQMAMGLEAAVANVAAANLQSES